MEKIYTEALSWSDLANDYIEVGKNPYVHDPSRIFDWAARQKKKYYVNKKEGTIHRIIHRIKIKKDE